MITAELPSKYHKKFEHFFVVAQNYWNCQQVFVNIEDKHFKIECSAIENTN